MLLDILLKNVIQEIERSLVANVDLLQWLIDDMHFLLLLLLLLLLGTQELSHLHPWDNRLWSIPRSCRLWVSGDEQAGVSDLAVYGKPINEFGNLLEMNSPSRRGPIHSSAI